MRRSCARRSVRKSRPIQLPEPLQYLPNIANLAQDIDGLARKIRGVPTEFLRRAFYGLEQDIENLLAATRESLDAFAEPSTVTAKELGVLAEKLEIAGSCTGPQSGSVPELLGYFDTLSYMEWTLRPKFSQEEERSQ